MDNEKEYDAYTVRTAFKHKDEVWGFACQTGRNNLYADTVLLNAFSEPVRGVLSNVRYESCYDDKEFASKPVEYFVPYKKRGDGLAWSKAVSIYNRHFAKTEDAAIKYFNAAIDDAIKGCNTIIQQLEARKI